MPTGNTLHIANGLKTFGTNDPPPIDVFVTATNCCDNPSNNDRPAVWMLPQGSADMFFCRTGGHGCNGEQGTFQLTVYGMPQGDTIITQGFNFDADGNLSLDQDGGWMGPNMEAPLSTNPDGTFLWTIQTR